MIQKIFRSFAYIAGVFFLLMIINLVKGEQGYSAFFFTAGMAALAISFNGFVQLKGFAYTMWILVAISLGMLYPHSFIQWGDFELKRLIVPFVQVTMLGMGAQMKLDDFKGVIKMPKGVITGVFCQFTVMPLVGFILSKVFHFPPEIAGGVVLIGCVPSASASNVMSYLAKANLALAVTIGATATLLAPFLTPQLMKLLGGQYVEVDVVGMMVDITNMIIVPIIAGFIFNLFYFNEKSTRSKLVQMGSFFSIILVTNLILHFSSEENTLSDSLYSLLMATTWFYLAPMIVAIILRHMKSISYSTISSALAFIAMMGIVINTVIITASGQESLRQVGLLLILSCFLHNIIGYTVGYTAAKLAKLPEKDRRSIAFEVGMQNGGVATGLALAMGKVATVGLASAIFGPLQNLTGSALVNIFKKRPVKE